MIASAGPYPTFIENLPHKGPLFWLFLLVLILGTLFGGLRIWRGGVSPISLALHVWMPTVVGCLLAALQSYEAEIRVEGNEAGFVYFGRPDRYIGHLRIYLGMGIACSLVLLAVHWNSKRRSNAMV